MQKQVGEYTPDSENTWRCKLPLQAESLIVRLQTPQRVDKEKICNYSRKTQLTKVADSNLSAGSAMPSTLRRDKTQIWITENSLANMQ